MMDGVAVQLKDLETDVVALRLMVSVLLTEFPSALEALRQSLPKLDDVTLFMDMDNDKRIALKATLQSMVRGCDAAAKP